MTKTAKVKIDPAFEYTDKSTGKRRSFAPKNDEMVVSFKDVVDDRTARKVMVDTNMAVSRGLNAGRGFAVFRVGRGGDASAARARLDAQPDVANALPVMQDQEGLDRYFLPDELTVQFKPDVSKDAALKVIADEKSEVLVEQRTPGYYTLAVPAGKGLFETIEAFSKRGEVAFAEPSEAGFNDALNDVQAEPDFGKLWGLHNTGQVVNGVTGTADADVDAPSAWTITRGRADVIVAVIDTGADLDHPDLAANVLPRGAEDWDFADAGDPSPDDVDGHGTHVSGTVAAVENSVGVVGLASGCRLMPLRINLTAGMNQNRADAINYVAAQAVAHPDRRYVINCSWKMNGDHAGVRNAIINAVDHNVVVCFAAANFNQDMDVTPTYPAVYPQVIAVAALDQRDRRASFSNYGSQVDVSAPGVNIYSSFPDNTHAFLDGTSMASPHVAALAALIWSRNRTLSNANVRAIIESTCDNIDAANPGFVGKLGRGRINAHRALLGTPPPALGFRVVRKLAFPQLNNGSSTALAFTRRFRVGLSLRPTLFFLTQQPLSEKIYFLNPTTGATVGSVDPVGNDTIGSLEWNGRQFLVANVTTGAGAINTIDAVTGAQLASLPVPPGRGEGLAFDGTFLYYSTINRIHVIRASTGAVVRSFPPPGGPSRALCFGDGLLFSGNSSTGQITAFDPVTLVVKGTIAAPGGGSERAEGLAYDAKTNELYVANQGENVIYVGVVTF